MPGQRLVTGVEKVDHRIGLGAQVVDFDNIGFAGLGGEAQPVAIAAVVKGMVLFRAISGNGAGAHTDIIVFKRVAAGLGGRRGGSRRGIAGRRAIQAGGEATLDRKVGAGDTIAGQRANFVLDDKVGGRALPTAGAQGCPGQQKICRRLGQHEANTEQADSYSNAERKDVAFHRVPTVT